MPKLILAMSYSLLLTLLLYSCHKNADNFENQTRYGSYLKNELTVPVYIQNGYRYLRNNADTTFISDKQMILPGGILKYIPYPNNLTGVTTPRTSEVATANTLWITIAGKVKRYYRCDNSNSSNTNDCAKGNDGFFNYSDGNWTKIKHPNLDSISNIYSINRIDSLKAQ